MILVSSRALAEMVPEFSSLSPMWTMKLRRLTALARRWQTQTPPLDLASGRVLVEHLGGRGEVA